MKGGSQLLKFSVLLAIFVHTHTRKRVSFRWPSISTSIYVSICSVVAAEWVFLHHLHQPKGFDNPPHMEPFKDHPNYMTGVLMNLELHQ